MITVKVEAKDLTKAINSISAWDAKSRLAVEDALKKGTKSVQRHAVQRAAVRTGRLKKSIKSGFSATKLEGRVYSNLPYAHLVEYGAKGTTVFPRRTKAMKMDIDGGAFSKKSVIPKRSPQPFMKPAYDYVMPDIIRDVEKAVKKC